MPSFWFCDTVRNLEIGNANVPWLFATLKLGLLGTLFIAIAVILFRRRFKQGLRP